MHSIISFFASIDPNLYNIAIFVAFLVYNLTLGLSSSRGITTLEDFALGGRNFTTATIAATIIATWIGGSFFFTIVLETYQHGLYYIWGNLASELTVFLSIGLIFAPRMGEFLGKMSIADAMGSVYGETVRVITAISGVIGITGLISVQLKVAGIAFEYALGIEGIYGVLTIGSLITIYSSLGGIKAVTFTDIIQFFTFGVVIPLVFYLLWDDLSSVDDLTNVIKTNPLFDYKQVFDFSQSKSVYFLFLFLFYAIPGLNAPMFQRIAMAKNTLQVKNSFIISAGTCFFLALAISAISLLTLVKHPNINSSDVVKTIIADCSDVFLFKGVMLAGIIAMVMSTVDSYINSTSVMVVHDLFRPFKIKMSKSELSTARLISLLIGAVAIGLSLRQGNLLKLIIAANAFYKPIVTVPFILTIMGFRSTAKSVLLGMLGGGVTVLLWNYFNIKVIDNIIPAMLANLIVLVASHYLLKQDGGLVGVKKPEPLINLRNGRKRRIKALIQAIKDFNILRLCQNNFPKSEVTNSAFGMFIIIISAVSVTTIPSTISANYTYLLRFIFIVGFTLGTTFIIYPEWKPKLKNAKLAGIVWNITVFSVLICFNCLIMFISNFYWVQIVTFFTSIIALLFLVRWQWALVHITLGTWLATFCYKNYIAIDPAALGYNIVYILDFLHKSIWLVILSSKFACAPHICPYMLRCSSSFLLKIPQPFLIYAGSLLSMISIVMLLFMKPKQDYHELAEEKIAHLEDQMDYHKHALEQALTIKNEFIRNISHETRIPVGGIVSNAQILWEKYDNLTDDQRRQAARDISKSGDRLISLTDNMIDLSKLSSMNPELTIINMNISELVQSRLAICQRLYLEDRPIEFHRKIEDNLYAECDGYYIRQTIDNLIINAIIYGKKGNVNIGLRRTDGMVEFSIEDEGIGIPLSELYDIFGAFTVSSKTRTPAGGRGVGLALCKRAIDVHLGNIWAESDGIKGSTFKFTLPVEYKGTQGKRL